MPGIIEGRLEELRLELPAAPKPVANFVPCVLTGNTLYVSGQVPAWNGELRYVGRVGGGGVTGRLGSGEAGKRGSGEETNGGPEELICRR